MTGLPKIKGNISEGFDPSKFGEGGASDIGKRDFPGGGSLGTGPMQGLERAFK